MNEKSTRLHERLAALPDVPLSGALWQRLEARRARTMRRRKRVFGLATLAVMAVLVVPFLAAMREPVDAVHPQALASAADGNGDADARAELRVLDQALQAAYDRGATDAEIAPMWVTRAALLAGISSGGSVPPPNRI